MHARILGALAVWVSFSACGVDVAVTAGHVAEMEATAAQEGQKQKEIAVERLNEATRLMEEQRKGMDQALSNPDN